MCTLPEKYLLLYTYLYSARLHLLNSFSLFLRALVAVLLNFHFVDFPVFSEVSTCLIPLVSSCLHRALEMGPGKYNEFPVLLDNIKPCVYFLNHLRLPFIFLPEKLFNLCWICGWISWYILLSRKELQEFKIPFQPLHLEPQTNRWLIFNSFHTSKNRRRMCSTL